MLSTSFSEMRHPWMFISSRMSLPEAKQAR
jgi:hypothetical protein